MIIWIIGSMASGKTTMNKMLFKTLNGVEDIDNETTQFKGHNIIYRVGNNAGSVGVLNENTPTCGIDPVMSIMKVEGVKATAQHVSAIRHFCIIEGAQAAYTWYQFIREIDPKFVLVHLNLSFEDNIMRLKQRQMKRETGRAVVPTHEAAYWRLSDKNYESIIGKNKQYNNLYDKIYKEMPKNCHKIDASQDLQSVFDDLRKIVLSCLH